MDYIFWLLNKLITPFVSCDQDRTIYINAAFKTLLTKQQDSSDFDLKQWLVEVISKKQDIDLLLNSFQDGTEVTVTAESNVKGTKRYWMIMSTQIPEEFSSKKIQMICFQDVSAARSAKSYWDLHLRMSKATMQLEKEINTRKKTEETLKKAQEQLVQNEKMSSLGVLSAGIAHEINNPINFISSNIDPLDDDFKDVLKILDQYSKITPDSDASSIIAEIKNQSSEMDLAYTIDKIKTLIQSIREGAHRTTTIVKDLRAFSRSDEDAVKKINLNAALDTTLTLLTPRYKKRIEIIKEYGEIPEIECYPGKINQVFMNVLANAIDAIPEEGKIWINTSKKNNQVFIKLRDSGQGISEEIIDKIFEPFFTTKEVGSGTGLGLSISYSIIKEHNGSIKVTSKLQQGTEFIITLPVLQKI